MADKEATVFILDVGSTMGQAHHGRQESDLDWSLRYFWDKLTNIIASNRKTLCVGVVALRTDGTSNKLENDAGYENISVLQEIGPVSMSSLKNLKSLIKPSKTWSGDAISAIVVAVDMIDSFTKKLKWVRKIVLVTDGQGSLDPEDIDPIAKKINESGIQLTILYVCHLSVVGRKADISGVWILMTPSTVPRKRTSRRPRYTQACYQYALC